jgi:hypothetical protein
MPVACHIPGQFPRAHREADQDHVAQVQGLQDRVQVRGERVVVITGADLRRLPETATVVSDDPVPGREELARLTLPAVPVQRVAVDEDDRLTRPLVLVIQLDRRAVLIPNGDESHDFPFGADQPTADCHGCAAVVN